MKNFMARRGFWRAREMRQLSSGFVKLPTKKPAGRAGNFWPAKHYVSVLEGLICPTPWASPGTTIATG
jgi:hypothetical protein